MSVPIKINKIRLLLCAMPSGLEGGIGAVVTGLEEGFRLSRAIEWKRIRYGRPQAVIGTFHRIIREILQWLHYIGCLITYRPHIIIVESSLDKKTVFRDSLYLYIALTFQRRFIIHAHGGEWHLIPTWQSHWKMLTNQMLKRSAAVIVTSQAEKEIIRSIYGDAVNVKKVFNPLIIPEGIHRKDTVRETPVIVFASRLIDTKGISEVIEAMPLLDGMPCELRVFGSGALESAMHQRVKELHLEERVKFYGQVTMERLLSEYAECDIFLFPSYHLEGFPMSLFFALAMGAPVIATPVRPLPEYLEEPTNCLWINERDKTMLANKIQSLLLSPKSRLLMSEANRKVAQQFNPVCVAEKMIQVFDECRKIC